MHLAINMDRVYHPSGFRAQAVMVKRKIVNRGAKRVLELGAGMGFNVLHLAEQLPEVEFVALDLMPAHVAAIRARAAELGLTNVTAVEASYEPIPAELGTFDVVFSVETLCYAVDLDAVAGAIARVLAPGGWFVMFDVFRNLPFEDFAPEMQRAVKLYEISMAVNNGFSNAPAWEAALTGAGMAIESCVDRSLEVLPGLCDLHRRTAPFVGDWKARLAVKAVPYLARNAVAGILGPYVYAQFELPAGRETGPLSYMRLSAFKR
ncbi:hypothetical protein LPB142_10535 [Rhodobacter xanthinilyticus]|uniref:Methyltransferase domain-containing protein n=1 Tax=Rhodobacter xanthinilyticus TaxID=1850250 RepID=A0A1D9MD38_9RHOB|nr:class I SAM-dependent methyltransferase [Rhodobacter xanthinilyticus]AOZ69698.1 hypothetical protein LPB142_10535 [Rhodobacter xanthinilyticus]